MATRAGRRLQPKPPWRERCLLNSSFSLPPSRASIFSRHGNHSPIKPCQSHVSPHSSLLETATALFIFYPGTYFSSPLIIAVSCFSSHSNFFISLWTAVTNTEDSVLIQTIMRLIQNIKGRSPLSSCFFIPPGITGASSPQLLTNLCVRCVDIILGLSLMRRLLREVQRQSKLPQRSLH